MPDLDELPYLIELLDDESEEVRSAIAEKLSQYGPSLKEHIEELDPPPGPEQRRTLQHLLEDQSRDRLLTVWPDWVELPNGPGKLEEGYRILSDYQTGYLYPERLNDVLGNLEEAYRSAYEDHDPISLAHFLFRDHGISGNEDDYYNPLNSNLLFAALEKKAIPITLSALFKLVGNRLGFRIEGCNFPGHFLARAYRGEDFEIIDCFNNGRTLDKTHVIEQARNVLDNRSIRRLLNFKLTPEDWFKRILRNLSNAYRRSGTLRTSMLMSMLRKYMDRYDQRTCDPVPVTKEYFSSLNPNYVPGQIVRHHRGRFRGVIVDFDLNCAGTESWYESVSPRPYREQPWYVILKDGSDESEYVAESVLRNDSSDNRVQNKMVEEYFTDFRNRFYVRNERSWVEPRP